MAAVLLAGAALAEGPIDPRVLELRLDPPKDPSEDSAATRANDSKRLTLEGCTLRIERKGSLPGAWSSSEVLWLGDLQTDPQKNMRREDIGSVAGAAAGNGPREVVTYYWRVESLIAFEDDIIRWNRDYERVLGPAIIAGDDSLSEEQRAEMRKVRTRLA